MIPLGILGNRRGGAAAGAYELISTTILGSASGSINLLSIPQTYKHLQLRFTAKASGTITEPKAGFYMSFGSSPANQTHFLRGNGSTVSSGIISPDYSNMPIGYATAPSTTTGAFSAGIIDLLDYTSTTKAKTFRSITGYTNSSSYIALSSGFATGTTAVDEWRIYCDANFATGSRFSLYGIKG